MALKIMEYCKSEFLQKQSEVDPKLVCKREHLVRTSSINTSVNFFCVAWIQRVYDCDRICAGARAGESACEGKENEEAPAGEERGEQEQGEQGEEHENGE